MELRHRHVLITGGCSGLGLSLAKKIIARCNKVTVFDVADHWEVLQGLQALAEQSGSGAKVIALPADVSNYIQVKKAVANAQQQHGSVDVVFANAGISPHSVFNEGDIELWEDINRVNYLGVVYTLKAVLPGMVQRGSGHAVITSSLLGVCGAAGVSAYAASKFALRGLADSIRTELLDTGVSLHLACPGWIDTPLARTAQQNLPPLCKAALEMFPSKLAPADQVMELMIRSVAKDEYLVKSSDVFGTLLLSSGLGPSSPFVLPTKQVDLQAIAEQTGSVAKVIALQADVSKFTEVKEAVAEAQKRHGPVDVVFANAGIAPYSALFVEGDIKLWEDINRVNYLGVVYTLKAVLPGMVQRSSGHAVITCSLAGVCGGAGGSAYAASKFALRGLADSIRTELLGTGVSLHLACPGWTDTPLARKAQQNLPPLCKAIVEVFPSKLVPVDQVTELMIQSIEKDEYLVKSPDVPGTLLLSSGLGPSSPFVLPTWLHILLAPLLALLQWYIRYAMDRTILKARATEKARKPSAVRKEE
ncbi:hypothetical protein WJX72_004457 [[Myrmecia] bisecta]|uniref:Ketoreductase domain-containing protein n=1 Tax=[Myrmecia] bisecta TaxID=41462 RepID=A0AAW1Q737_9CHLO